MVTSLMSNKREWNNCFIKFLKLEKFESTKYERNRKNLMKMRCCVRPCGQTDAGSSQKHFVPFRVFINIGIDPNFPQKLFFCFFRREISLSGENNFNVATLTAIICHITEFI